MVELRCKSKSCLFLHGEVGAYCIFPKFDPLPYFFEEKSGKKVFFLPKNWVFSFYFDFRAKVLNQKLFYFTSGVQNTSLIVPITPACTFLYQKTCKKVGKNYFFNLKMWVFSFYFDFRAKVLNQKLFCTTSGVQDISLMVPIRLACTFLNQKTCKKVGKKYFFNLKMEFFRFISILKPKC